SGTFPSPEPARPQKSGDPESAKPLFGQNDTSSAGAGDGSGGDPLDKSALIGPGLEGKKEGLFALEKADIFNLLCIPPYSADQDIEVDVLEAAISYCRARRAMLLIDPPHAWTSKEAAKNGIKAEVGSPSPNAAVFFPRLLQLNPLHDGQIEPFAPCGAVAGVFARTDGERGVWKAPAGLAAT